jgi:hypothetical protein
MKSVKLIIESILHQGCHRSDRCAEFCYTNTLNYFTSVLPKVEIRKYEIETVNILGNFAGIEWINTSIHTLFILVSAVAIHNQRAKQDKT